MGRPSPAPTASASPATTAPSPSPAKPSLNSAPASSSAVSVNKKEPLNFDILNDKTRNACLKVIHTALEAGSEPGSVDAHVMFQRAREVEQATFKLIGKGEINNEYRQKMRSLSLNLKDKRNPTLSQGVVAGIIEADKLVLMTPEEMESDEKKAERAALQMQNLFKAKAAAAQGESGLRLSCRATSPSDAACLAPRQRQRRMHSSVASVTSESAHTSRSRRGVPMSQ